MKLFILLLTTLYDIYTLKYNILNNTDDVKLSFKVIYACVCV